jgi:uncharacterized membrane protein YebE (DUF533 family)
MFDTKKLLNDLLGEAKTLADKAGGGSDRGAMMKGGAAGVVLGLLLGSKGGRKIGGKALKLGSLAALGVIAMKAYQQWQASKTAPASGTISPNTPTPQITDQTQAEPMVLFRAMIAAARADGHIDEAEHTHIIGEAEKLGLGGDFAALISQELNQPLSAAHVAANVSSPIVAAEVYALSLAVVDSANPQEAAYLDALAEALKLDPGLKSSIEAEVAA